MPDVHKFPFDIAVAFDAQGKAVNQIADADQKKAAQQAYQQAMNERAKQAAARSILRALYATDQLRERMTWFWFNHFNVHQYKANIRILVGDYVARAIRPFALGKFHDLLTATLYHPAMLRYLDNADNAVGHLNENYAREIMELHTMGVGSGYAQSDVEALARILTGIGVDLKPEDPRLKPELQSQLVREGAFEFNPPGTITATRFSWVMRSRDGDSPKSTKRSISWSIIPPPPPICRDRSRPTSFGESAGGAGAADGADLQDVGRRHRRGVVHDGACAGVRRLAEVRFEIQGSGAIRILGGTPRLR